jgi:hypothetical protein
MLEENAVHFSSKNSKILMTGLVAASVAERTVLLTATLDMYGSRFLSMVLNVPVKNQFEFKSIAELHDKTAEKNDSIEKRVYNGNVELLRIVGETVKRLGEEQPFILFLEEEISNFDVSLKQICRDAKISYQCINDRDTAKSVRASMR